MMQNLIKKIQIFKVFVGDIRDSQRLERALEGVDYVIHAAALKQVVTSEYNPFETIKTNVIGAQNLLEACLNKSVKRLLHYQQIKRQVRSTCMALQNYVLINYLFQPIQ